MSLKSHQVDQLHELLALVRDDRLEAADQNELESLVLADPQACRLFVDTMHILASLRWVYGDDQTHAAPADTLAAAAESTAPQAVVPVDAPPPTILGYLSDWVPVTFVARSWLFWIVAVLANAVFVFLLALAVSPNFRARVTGQVAPFAGAPAPSVGRGPAVARLVLSAGCKWDMPHPPAVGATLAAGSLRMRAGLAEFEMTDGARIQFDGPNDFEFRDAAHVHLYAGHLRANVPRQAIGFCVLTPAAEVIDLGTEFGVTTSETGSTEVQVYRGQVSVQPLAAQPAAPATAAATRTILHAGQYKRIEPFAEPTDVAGEQPPPREAIAAVADPAQGTWPDSLVAYWNFDDERSIAAGRRVPGLVGRGAAGFEADGTEKAGPLVWRHNVPLDDRATVEAVLVSHWSGKRGDNQYVLRHALGSQTTLLLALANTAQTAGPAVVLAVATRQGPRSIALPLDGQQGRPSLAELTDGAPHHLAATFQKPSGAGRAQMTLYVDGRQRTGGAIDADPVGAAGPRGLELGGEERDSFSGVLDEVALYHGVLTAEQIAQHWQAAQEGHAYFSHTALLASPFPGDELPLVNGTFETIYKSANDQRVTGVLDPSGSYVSGFGLARLYVGSIAWSDGTVGTRLTAVNIPGWNGPAAYSGVQARAASGHHGVYVNGPAFGAPATGTFLTSAAPLGTIERGFRYTLSLDVCTQEVPPNGPTEVGGPLFASLLADGAELAPTERNVPGQITAAWQKVSVSYSAESLRAVVGRPLGVKIGLGPNATGNQLDFDNVRVRREPDGRQSETLLLGAAVPAGDERLPAPAVIGRVNAARLAQSLGLNP